MIWVIRTEKEDLIYVYFSQPVLLDILVLQVLYNLKFYYEFLREVGLSQQLLSVAAHSEVFVPLLVDVVLHPSSDFLAVLREGSQLFNMTQVFRRIGSSII